MSAYLRPETLDEALGCLHERPCTVLAGATDLYPAEANARGWGRPGMTHPGGPALLDISAIAQLRRIERFEDRVEIGAGVTWSDAIGCDLPSWFDGVRLAGREVGGRQIQNRGTLAGNLCNASPAADGMPALLCLDARVRLARRGAVREIPLETFVTGNRRTGLAEDELLTAIVIPRPDAGSRSTFLKLGARRYLVISIAMVGVNAEIRDARITRARIAVGACSEVAVRLRALESRLADVAADAAAAQVEAADLAALSPISDVRAPASYRRHAARVLVQRALTALADAGSAPGDAP